MRACVASRLWSVNLGCCRISESCYSLMSSLLTEAVWSVTMCKLSERRHRLSCSSKAHTTQSGIKEKIVNIRQKLHISSSVFLTGNVNLTPHQHIVAEWGTKQNTLNFESISGREQIVLSSSYPSLSSIKQNLMSAISFMATSLFMWYFKNWLTLSQQWYMLYCCNSMLYWCHNTISISSQFIVLWEKCSLTHTHTHTHYFLIVEQQWGQPKRAFLGGLFGSARWYRCVMLLY